MIETLEAYLVDLMNNFNEFGILDADGKPFQPNNFKPGPDFNTWGLKEFELDTTQAQHSHHTFYDPKCDGIESDPALLNTIKTSGRGWVDASTNEHQYPVNAAKAMWNHALHSLQMFMTNPLSLLANKAHHENFMYYTSAYMDDTPVKAPEAVAVGVRYYCIPRVVDQRTLAFAESCLKFINLVAAYEDPLGDIKKMYWYAPQSAHDEIDKKKAKTMMGFKVTQAALIDRIGRYKARAGMIPMPAPEEQEALRVSISRLKSQAIETQKKYQNNFETAAKIEQEYLDFPRNNPRASNEEKAVFYRAKIAEIKVVDAQPTPTHEEIQADINALSKTLTETLPNQLNEAFGAGQTYLFAENYPAAIYEANQPETEVVFSVKTDITQTFRSTLEKISRYEKNSADEKQKLESMKFTLEKAIGEVTVRGKIIKLVTDKNAAESEIAKLKEQKAQLAQTLANLEREIASAKTKVEEFGQNAAEKNVQLDDNRKSLVIVGKEIQRQENELHEKIALLSFADEWDQKIDSSLMDAIGGSLHWTLEDRQKWDKKDDDYANWKASNHNSSSSDSTLGYLWSAASRSVSHYSNIALSTVVNQAPRQELVAEINKHLYELERQHTMNQNQFDALQDEARNLFAPREALLVDQRELEQSADSIREQIAQKEASIEDKSGESSALSTEYATLITQCTRNLESRITQCKNELATLLIGPANLEQLKNILGNTSNDIKKIKEEHDSIADGGRDTFFSEELTRAHQDFNTQHQNYERNQVTLLDSLVQMTNQLIHDYQAEAKEKGPEFRKNQQIIVLAEEVKNLALIYLPQDKTLAEKIQAKKNFEKNCELELYSNNIKISIGAVLGVLTSIILTATAIVALATFFAAGGWLAVILGAPVILKVAAIAGASTLGIVGGVIGGAAGESLDDKQTQEYYESWRFFYHNVTEALPAASPKKLNAVRCIDSGTANPNKAVDIPLNELPGNSAGH
jgi:3-phenylpropionate/cinnamic acid dioxygenase small subunit